MIDNDHGMRDTVVRVTGSWEVDSEDECGAVPVTWNLNAGSQVGALPTTDVKVKLRRLTAVNYNNDNWSWLLDPNKPPEPPVLPKKSSSSKIRTASEPEEPAREGILSTVDLGKLDRRFSLKGRGLALSPRVPCAPR